MSSSNIPDHGQLDLLDTSVTFSEAPLLRPLVSSHYLIYPDSAASTQAEQPEPEWDALQQQLRLHPFTPPLPVAPDSPLLIHFTSPLTAQPTANQLVLPSSLARPSSRSSPRPSPIPSPALKKPSPLKFEVELSDSSLESSTSSLETAHEDQESTPIKSRMVGKKWGAIERMWKAKDEGAPKLDSRPERGVPDQTEDEAGVGEPSMALSGVLTTAGDYSLIADERGSFLLSQDEITLDSFTVLPTSTFTPAIWDESSDECIEDVTQLIGGFGGSLSASAGAFGMDRTAAILPKSLTSSVKHRKQTDDRELLFSSTVSYRDHRNSPGRPRATSWQANAGLLEGDEERTPVKFGTPRSHGSGSGTESSGDIGRLLQNWKGDESETGEIRETGPPTDIMIPEATLTMEMGLQSPLRPTGVVAPPPPSRAIRPASISHNRSSSFPALASLSSSTSAPIAEEPEPGDELTSSSTGAPSGPSRQDRLRFRLEELKVRKAIAPATPRSVASRSALVLAATAATTPRRRAPVLDENDAVFVTTGVLVDVGPPTPLLPSTSAVKGLKRLSLRPPSSVKKLEFASSSSSIGSVPASARLAAVEPPRSVRKESTREKLDRAKDERKRRESAFVRRTSPPKPSSLPPSHVRSGGLPSLGDHKVLASSPAVMHSHKMAPSSSSRLVRVSATSSATARQTLSLAEALAKKPSTRSTPSFNPTIPAPRPSSSKLSLSATRPPPSNVARLPSPAKAPNGLGGLNVPKTGLKRPSAVTRAPLGSIQEPALGATGIARARLSMGPGRAV